MGTHRPSTVIPRTSMLLNVQEVLFNEERAHLRGKSGRDSAASSTCAPALMACTGTTSAKAGSPPNWLPCSTSRNGCPAEMLRLRPAPCYPYTGICLFGCSPEGGSSDNCPKDEPIFDTGEICSEMSSSPGISSSRGRSSTRIKDRGTSHSTQPELPLDYRDVVREACQT